MRRKIMVFVLILAMVTGLIPATALAASPPSEISAPENFAAADYMGISAVCTLSAPDDLASSFPRQLRSAATT